LFTVYSHCATINTGIYMNALQRL